MVEAGTGEHLPGDGHTHARGARRPEHLVPRHAQLSGPHLPHFPGECLGAAETLGSDIREDADPRAVAEVGWRDAEDTWGQLEVTGLYRRSVCTWDIHLGTSHHSQTTHLPNYNVTIIFVYMGIVATVA